MNDAESFSAWATLHRMVAESPQRHPVNDWHYRHPMAADDDLAMDLWPIIKVIYMVGACHRVHAGAASQAPVPLAPFDVLEPAKGARQGVPAVPAIRPPPAALRWPTPDCHVLMLGGSAGNHDFDGYLAQKHLDPLRQALALYGLRTATVLNDVAAKSPLIGRTLLGGTYGFAPVLLAAQRHLPSSGTFDLSELPGFDTWHAEISALYSFDSVLGRQALVEIIEKIYSTSYCLRRYFAYHAIKAVIGYCYYGVVGLATALACRTLGIPYFDMQHGSAGRNHHCYHWPGAPEGGYNTLPSHFLCWSPVERRAIEDCASLRGPTALTVGHSWQLMEQLIHEARDSSGVAHGIPSAIGAHYAAQCAAASQRKAASAAAGLTTVLLTLRDDEDIGWLEPLLAEAATDSHMRFLIRLHPTESRDAARLARRVATLETAAVEVTRPSHAPMPVVLRECDLHLTHCSSSILDALAFGVPSISYSWSSRWFYSADQFQHIEVVPPEATAVRGALLAHRAAPPPLSLPPAGLSLFEVGGLVAREILTLRTSKFA